MKELVDYFKSNFNTNQIGDITFAHAVNNPYKLKESLSDEGIMFVETDITVNSKDHIVCAHSPDRDSDLDFNEFIEKMARSNKGIKLDFKKAEAVEPVLTQLKSMNIRQPVILNADVIQGNTHFVPLFNPSKFIDLCKDQYPKGMLSLGFTTMNNGVGYNSQNIDEALFLASGLENVTFPIRASLLPGSKDEVNSLLRDTPHTLTIWTGREITDSLSNWVMENTDPTRTFYDLTYA